MNFNLKQFKKIKEDEHSAVLQHPEGHHIVIAKKILSPKLRSQLAELPTHMADGGDVAEEPIAKNESMASERSRANDPNFQQQFPEAKPVGQAPVVINVGQGAQQPQAPQVEQPPAQQPQVAQQGVPKNALGDFDFNRFTLQNPDATPQQKMLAMNRLDLEKQQLASADQRQKLAQQSDYQDAIKYNQMAAERGYPPMAVPPAPAEQAPAPMAPQAAPQIGVGEALQQAPQMPQDPYGTDAYQKYFEQGVGKQVGGIQEQAKQEGLLGQQQADILGKQVEQQQQAQKSYQDHYTDLENERQSFQNDIKNMHVDPQHYLSNMGTGHKIATGIGLILGGMGGGLTHQGNAALDFLNRQIDRDIASQKDNIGKTENLLSANMRQFGNLRDATDMTRVMQMDIVKNQLAQAAATAQSPMAQARAQQAIGAIDQQIAPIMSQMAMRKSLSQQQMGGQTQGDPAAQIRMQSMMGFIPKEQVEPMLKELKEAEEVTRARNNLLSAFDNLDKLNTLSNRTLSPIQSASQVAAIRDPLIAQLSKATAGRFTEADSKFVGTLFPSVGDSAETIQRKRIQLRNLIEEKMNFPMLKAYGIHMDAGGGNSRFGAGGEKKIQLGAPVLSQR